MSLARPKLKDTTRNVSLATWCQLVMPSLPTVTMPYLYSLVTVTYKILATDYNTTALIYSCFTQDQDGVCIKSTELLQVLGRTTERDDDSRQIVHDFITKRICIEPTDIIQSTFDGTALLFG